MSAKREPAGAAAADRVVAAHALKSVLLAMAVGGLLGYTLRLRRRDRWTRGKFGHMEKTTPLGTHSNTLEET